MPDRSFAGQLDRESEAWVAEGIVSAEQAAAIRNRYASAREESRGRATVALAVIGAIAVGFGVIGFVAANWDGMSHGARLALLTLAVGGSYAAGFHLRERTDRSPRVGEALYLVGVLLFGASLFLVGQMYHVEAHDPLALLIWAGGAAATALVVRSHPIEWLALVIFTGWVGWEFGLAIDETGGDAWASFPVLAVAYGTALYGLGTVARERAFAPETAFPRAARGLGLPIAAAGLFVFTFAGAADELDSAGDRLGTGIVAGYVSLTALALAAAAALALLRRRSAILEAAGLATTVVAVAAAVLLGGDGGLWAIVFNLLFAALALGIIYAGFLSDEAWLVNLGVVLVAVDLVARYFDVFWDALPRSVGMIGAGLLVLGIAYVLERQRKRLLERMAAS